MDFIDEKCDVFDNDDENKFVYTDIHNEFVAHVGSVYFVLFMTDCYEFQLIVRWKLCSHHP